MNLRRRRAAQRRGLPDLRGNGNLRWVAFRPRFFLIGAVRRITFGAAAPVCQPSGAMRGVVMAVGHEAVFDGVGYAAAKVVEFFRGAGAVSVDASVPLPPLICVLLER